MPEVLILRINSVRVRLLGKLFIDGSNKTVRRGATVELRGLEKALYGPKALISAESRKFFTRSTFSRILRRISPVDNSDLSLSGRELDGLADGNRSCFVSP